MKFKAALYISYAIKDTKLPEKPMLIFTKHQLFYQKNANIVWQDSHIRSGAFYKLKVYDKPDIRHKYEIQVETSKPLGLQVKGINEMKLKWIHGMYRIQKEPIAFITLIIAVLTLIVSIVAIMLQIQSTK